MEVSDCPCLTTTLLLVVILNVTSEIQREGKSYHNDFHRPSPGNHLSRHTTESGICTSHYRTWAGMTCINLKKAEIYTAVGHACHMW